MNARIPCAVTQDLNRYLDQQERAEARAELIDARCEELMKPGAEYSPIDAKAISDALAESEPKFWQNLAAALGGDVRSSLPGYLIRAECESYWTKLALPEAERQIDAERQDAADRAAEDRAEDRRDHERDGL